MKAKEKSVDLLGATAEEATSLALSSQPFVELMKNLAKDVVQNGGEAVLDGAIGSLPSLYAVRLGYKQRQFERNMKEALSAVTEKMQDLEENYRNLTAENKKAFDEVYSSWLIENLEDEKQKSKVPYHVKGYINLMSNETNDNQLLMYFNTLNELTQLDIDVLSLYAFDKDETIYDVCERYGLDSSQVQVIKEKLERHGLLVCKNDEQRDQNTDLIVQYLTDVDKDNKKSNPRGVKLPRIRKPSKAQSYSITSLGRNFLKVIEKE